MRWRRDPARDSNAAGSAWRADCYKLWLMTEKARTTKEAIKKRPPPAVLIVSPEGTIMGQNEAARQVLGDVVGQHCWEAMGKTPSAHGLPCRPGCTRTIARKGIDGSREVACQVGGAPYRLVCSPTGPNVVCVLSRQAPEEPGPWESLTPREREVITLVAAGCTTGEIAEALDISESTVRTHIEHMRIRFGAHTRAELVARCIRTGLIE